MNQVAVEKAKEFSEELEEKKPGLFLVSDHPAQGSVWLDCRRGGVPRVYGFSEDDEELSDIRKTKPIKAVRAAARSKGCSRLDAFGGESQ